MMRGSALPVRWWDSMALAQSSETASRRSETRDGENDGSTEAAALTTTRARSRYSMVGGISSSTTSPMALVQDALDRVTHDEGLVEAGDVQHLGDVVAGAGQAEVAVVGPGPLEAADQRPQAHRVDEAQPAQVDDQTGRALVDELHEPVAQAGGRRHVDLTGQA